MGSESPDSNSAGTAPTDNSDSEVKAHAAQGEGDVGIEANRIVLGEQPTDTTASAHAHKRVKHALEPSELAKPIVTHKNELQGVQSQQTGKGQAKGQKLRKRDRVIRKLFQPKLIHAYDAHSHDREVKAGWTELFFDLIYVGAFTKLADRFNETTNVSGVGTVLLYTWAFLSTWFSFNHYFASFTSDGMLHMYKIFMVMGGAVVMVIYVQEEDTYKEGFAWGFILSKTALASLYIFVAIYVRAARRAACTIVVCMLISSAFWLGSVFVSSYDVAYLLWVGGLSVDGMVFMLRGSSFREDTGYLTERMGNLVILVLGESILSIVLDAQVGASNTLRVAFLAFLTVYQLQLNYFTTVPEDDAYSAIAENMWLEKLVYTLHVVACFGLLAVGMGYKLAMEYHDQTIPRNKQWIFCTGMAVALLSIQLIRTANQNGFHLAYLFSSWLAFFFLFTRMALPCVVATMPLWDLNTIALVSSTFTVVVIYVFLDLTGHKWYERKNGLRDSLDVPDHDQMDGEIQDRPEFQEFVEWGAPDIEDWALQQLHLGEASLDKIRQCGITADKLFLASAAEMIHVFGAEDGSSLILELNRIKTGRQTPQKVHLMAGNRLTRKHARQQTMPNDAHD